jgi:DNA polymerase III psi subunit
MNTLEDVLKALDFSDDMIREVSRYERIETFDNDLPIIEYEIDEDGSYTSNMAIVETYNDLKFS